jgi:hypothetical protein
MGITDEERVEILDADGRTHDWDGRGGIPAGEAWIMQDELDRWADGRFVHADLARPDEALAASEEAAALVSS